MKTWFGPWFEEKDSEYMCSECGYVWGYKPPYSMCPFCEEDDMTGKIIPGPDKEERLQMQADKQMENMRDDL
jgi:hypothetical protein